MNAPSILILYTGGTIGMVENHETHALEAFDWEHLCDSVPELDQFHFRIDAVTLGKPIDSSEMTPEDWILMARTIEENYDHYDGFVLLHGTDTMAYTASFLSFILEGLSKPVIITGSQLPIGQLRTDGKENLLTSIEIAAARHPDGTAMVPEVCIFFENELMRGNRTTKINSEGFSAFRSYNFAPLAVAGIHIDYNTREILYPERRNDIACYNILRRCNGGMRKEGLNVHFNYDNHIAILTLFPGISEEVVRSVARADGLRALVLQTFGSGNAPRKQWLIDILGELKAKGVIVVNTSQCEFGTVEMGRYGTSLQLLQEGVINGYDATLECVVTKLMFLLGNGCSTEEVRQLMSVSIAGEINVR